MFYFIHQVKHGRPCPWLRSVPTCRRLNDWGSSTPSITPTTSTGLAGGSRWRRAQSLRLQKPPRSAAQASVFPATSPVCSRTSSRRTTTPCLSRFTAATETTQVFHPQLQHTRPQTTRACTQRPPVTKQNLRCTLAPSSDTRSMGFPLLQGRSRREGSPGSTGSSHVQQGPRWSSTCSRFSWTCCMIWTAASLNSTWVRTSTNLGQQTSAASISRAATEEDTQCHRAAHLDCIYFNPVSGFQLNECYHPVLL